MEFSTHIPVSKDWVWNFPLAFQFPKIWNEICFSCSPSRNPKVIPAHPSYQSIKIFSKFSWDTITNTSQQDSYLVQKSTNYITQVLTFLCKASFNEAASWSKVHIHQSIQSEAASEKPSISSDRQQVLIVFCPAFELLGNL